MQIRVDCTVIVRIKKLYYFEKLGVREVGEKRTYTNQGQKYNC